MKISSASMNGSTEAGCDAGALPGGMIAGAGQRPR